MAHTMSVKRAVQRNQPLPSTRTTRWLLASPMLAAWTICTHITPQVASRRTPHSQPHSRRAAPIQGAWRMPAACLQVTMPPRRPRWVILRRCRPQPWVRSIAVSLRPRARERSCQLRRADQWHHRPPSTAARVRWPRIKPSPQPMMACNGSKACNQIEASRSRAQSRCQCSEQEYRLKAALLAAWAILERPLLTEAERTRRRQQFRANTRTTP